MLRLEVNLEEFWDESANEFLYQDSVTLELEHSLLSLAKWEQKFLKPFLGPGEKTQKEVLGYIEAMVLNDEHPKGILKHLTQEHLTEINEYIDSPATATTFSDIQTKRGQTRQTQIITSELVYYWMIVHTIPFECETWHLNRLFALIRICNMKSGKQPKMSKSEIAARNRALNEERKARLGTSG